jgi:hypothetical protein
MPWLWMLLQALTTIGLDIAKAVFQVHGFDAEDNVIMAHSCAFSNLPFRPMDRWGKWCLRCWVWSRKWSLASSRLASAMELSGKI